MTSKIYILIISVIVLVGCGTKQNDDRTEFFPKSEQKPIVIPDKENVLVFILTGQSNMAGRGKVEPIDTIPDSRIFTINKKGEVYLKTDSNLYLILTNDLKDKGDKVHFDSKGQREIGKRFAERFIKI